VYCGASTTAMRRMFTKVTANPIDNSRRNLLRGRPGLGQTAAVRPPWALIEGFEARCSRCDRCIQHCETGILIRGDGGFPQVDFRRGDCSFCGDCVKVCDSGALHRGQARPWRIKAAISAACLSAQGISCRSCGEACDPRAISFRLQTGGRALPEVEQGFCSGCGACVAVCPVQAIEVRQPVAVVGETNQLEGAA
jgi:ferredoxin-type protein NapF